MKKNLPILFLFTSALATAGTVMSTADRNLDWGLMFLAFGTSAGTLLIFYKNKSKMWDGLIPSVAMLCLLFWLALKSSLNNLHLEFVVILVMNMLFSLLGVTALFLLRRRVKLWMIILPVALYLLFRGIAQVYLGKSGFIESLSSNIGYLLYLLPILSVSILLMRRNSNTGLLTIISLQPLLWNIALSQLPYSELFPIGMLIIVLASFFVVPSTFLLTKRDDIKPWRISTLYFLAAIGASIMVLWPTDVANYAFPSAVTWLEVGVDLSAPVFLGCLIDESSR